MKAKAPDSKAYHHYYPPYGEDPRVGKDFRKDIESRTDTIGDLAFLPLTKPTSLSSRAREFITHTITSIINEQGKIPVIRNCA